MFPFGFIGWVDGFGDGVWSIWSTFGRIARGLW